MTWREKVVVKILLLVAQIVTDEDSLRRALQTVATHISVGPGPEAE